MHRFERLINASDPELAAHGERTGRLARDIAVKMSLSADRIERLELASLLHDIGKIFIPRSILDKPGPLDEAEWEELRRHPMMGYQLVRDSVPEEVARIVLNHHERFDGTGYPHAVPGPKISLEARILQVADAFDAITSDRPYQPALPVAYALNEMLRCAGSQFDPGPAEAMAALASRPSWVAARFGEELGFSAEIAV
ncbi:MAG: HD-GYP domain-containing protein [bacterium]|nr:HD-GYP domain-containing protein [bacterium]